MKLISIIVPAFNEEKNILPLYEKLEQELFNSWKEKYSFEVVFINDGSRDKTLEEIAKLAGQHPEVKFIDFSRNFGKELATTAGLNFCHGDAAMIIDADHQHPIRLIGKFIEKWEEGFEIVIGIRQNGTSNNFIKKMGSDLFYAILKRISDFEIVPKSTDFRLIDRVVIDEFNRFTESNRMTRALIDWLGFKKAYIPFEADERLNGDASYSLFKLFGLAMNGFVSLSLLPLKFASYLGTFITLVSGVLGLYILLGKYILHTGGFASTFSDAESLAVFIVFLVGIILISIGFLAIYIANIYSEVINRPLYVVRKKNL